MKNKIDQNGLEPDDEFYELSFAQVSDAGVTDVKPCTYALMTWWKVWLRNSDTIDITEQSNKASLRFETDINGIATEDAYFRVDETITTDNFIEVDEIQKIIKFFAYVTTPVPQKILNIIKSGIYDFNRESNYGYAEIFSVENDTIVEHYIRYKVSTYLEGIKVGKIKAIDILVDNAQSQCAILFYTLCADENVKKWLISEI